METVTETTTASTTNINNDDDDDKKSLVLTVENNFGFGSNVIISQHPIMLHKITILRSSATHSGTFRAVLKELTYHLGYEATRSLSTKPIPISVPLPKKHTTTNNSSIDNGDCNAHDDYLGHKLIEQIALVPILRSGLGMVDSMLELIPSAEVHHIGMYKSSIQDHPVLYYNRLPRKCNADVAYVLDPCIATASTVKSVVAILKRWGVKKIHVLCVIGSLSGIQSLLQEYEDITITVGTIDDVVTSEGHILPGLGDAGDRLFGTAPVVDDDEALVHPSRRKRALSQSIV